MDKLLLLVLCVTFLTVLVQSRPGGGSLFTKTPIRDVPQLKWWQKPAPGCIFVNTTFHRLMDSYQRERYFHGVNVVVKGPPWLPHTDKFDAKWSFSEEDMQLLKKWGLNGIRLGMMWPGVEPKKGQYNQTYLDIAKSLVNKAGEYGIYTLLDMHQDSLAQKFCGEGLPDWAVDIGDALPFPFPLGAPFKDDPNTGHPTDKDCAKHSWPSYQFTEALSKACQNLYSNKNGLRDSFATFWGKVAQEFFDNSYVIGYDIINEPWAGDIYSDPLLLVPGEADRKNLAPFYEAVHTEIRKHDECHSFFFESVTWDEGGVGFEKVPGGKDYENRSVVCFHFYVPPQISEAISFEERRKDVERLNCGSFLSEFSLGSVSTMDAADEYLTSWLGWDYKGYVPITGSGNGFWFDNGTLNTDVVQRTSRTYAQVVAGVTMKMKYDSQTNEFYLKYFTNRFCTSNTTEIYLNEEFHYNKGYNVHITHSPSEGGVEWISPEPNCVHVIHNISLPEGMVIEVNITAKKIPKLDDILI